MSVITVKRLGVLCCGVSLCVDYWDLIERVCEAPVSGWLFSILIYCLYIYSKHCCFRADRMRGSNAFTPFFGLVSHVPFMS